MTRVTTTCPQCATIFRVNPEQLAARRGQVRCGRCRHVFNGYETVSVGPTAGDGEAAPAAAAGSGGRRPWWSHLPGLGRRHAGGTARARAADTRWPASQDTAGRLDGLTRMVDLVQTESDGGALPSGGLRVRPAFGFELERAGSDFSLATVQRRRRSGLIALALAVIGLPAAALLARGPIVQFAPALRPILVSVCLPLRCQVPLPADADAWSVESNELREDPVGSRRFRFTATLRNRSPYVMAYPSLELNLTDVDGLAVERRILPPAKYLPIPRPVEEGLGANSEVTVRAEVLAADARSQGYRLVLFFP